MSFARHSSLTDLTQRSAYEFKFGLLAGKVRQQALERQDFCREEVHPDQNVPL